ncbi:acyltransferase [Micromonospora chersina]|uniref:acyltransferase n=1 Tax=Micromonospora chersina TaxID=47854 RepID=UPI0033EC79FE
MSGTSRARIAYQPALDGVRALAVAAVLAFHGGVAALPGGFLGVDAFFVLSGFLITSLLLAEHRHTGRIDLVAFWGRRVRRLLPALLLVLLVVLLVSRKLMPGTELGALRWDELAALGYVANWRMANRDGDYFAATGSPSPLQHTWSLGIEEQFYLLWPLLLIALLAWAARRGAAAGPASRSRSPCWARPARRSPPRRCSARPRWTASTTAPTPGPSRSWSAPRSPCRWPGGARR